MNDLPIRRTADLRKGRVSVPHARYFVTCAAVRPERRLAESGSATRLQEGIADLEHDGDIKHLCSTIMPDHMHILFALTGRLTVSQAVGKLKSRTRKVLDAQGVRWQENFFEHRLRPDDPVGNIARYVFLNPYRAGLIAGSGVWPWWSCGSEADFDFLHQLYEGKYPPPEWITAPLEELGVVPQAVGRD